MISSIADWNDILNGNYLMNIKHHVFICHGIFVALLQCFERFGCFLFMFLANIWDISSWFFLQMYEGTCDWAESPETVSIVYFWSLSIGCLETERTLITFHSSLRIDVSQIVEPKYSHKNRILKNLYCQYCDMFYPNFTSGCKLMYRTEKFPEWETL